MQMSAFWGKADFFEGIKMGGWEQLLFFQAGSLSSSSPFDGVMGN